MKKSSGETKFRKYTVGEVSKITGVSKDMLRFYDKMDLVKPAYKSPANGYRYYTHDQFWLIDIIQMCRGLDISLKEIKLMLEAKSDDKVLEVMMTHQKTALERSLFYKKVADDIEWYASENRKMNAAFDFMAVTVKQFPERYVLLGEDKENTEYYHLKLQEISRSSLKYPHTFVRHYGFMPGIEEMKANRFVKQAEYLELETDMLREVSADNLTVIPAGRYACCIVKVRNDHADFSSLLTWCEKENVSVEYVIADEIGLHLFYYTDQDYYCEAKVLLKEL